MARNNTIIFKYTTTAGAIPLSSDFSGVGSIVVNITDGRIWTLHTGNIVKEITGQGADGAATIGPAGPQGDPGPPGTKGIQGIQGNTTVRNAS